MNKNDFSKKIFDALNSYDVELKFVTSWYQGVVNALRSVKDQARNIKHPRHLGDFLEDEVSKIIGSILPQRYLIDKGFVINDFSSISQEQDILIVDTLLGSPICKTDMVGYYPVESVMGSIEVKSNLNLSELRKCFISCVSVKKQYFPAFNYEDSKDNRIFYAIFAYKSSCSKKSFQEELSLCLKKIPESLRPNMIYILDQGIYLPTNNDVIYLDLESIQTTKDGYRLIENSAHEQAESQNITLFFSMLIEHAFHQSSLRKPAKYSSYVLNPSMWERKLNEDRDSQVPIKKLINKYTRWSDSLNGELLVIFEESCSKCNKKYKFYTLPPGPIKEIDKLKIDLEEKDCKPLPKNKKYTCNCGESLIIEEACE